MRKPVLEWRNRFLLGDVREQLALLPKNSVHTVITSPPYYALRDYNHAGQIGLEDTIEEYIEGLVGVFEEVRRVLRPEGTLWVNMGDAYVGGRRGGGARAGAFSNQGASRDAQVALEARKSFRRDKANTGDTRHKVANVFDGHHHSAAGLKPKNLMGQPWRLAFALQRAGWILRSDNIWAKPNPTPESTRDRTTRAHEYLFMFSKRGRYFYDAEAIREPVSAASLARIRQRTFAQQTGGPKDYANVEGSEHRSARRALENLAAQSMPTANKRSVWTIAPQPSPLKHFATFPMDLVAPCIKAGASEAGCCAMCGRPYRRVVEKVDHAGVLGVGWHDHQDDLGRGQRGVKAAEHAPTRRTVGWAPACKHDAGVVPCVVLDPFMGTGSTAAAAHELGRDWCGIDVNADYVAMATKRLHRLEQQQRIKLQPVLIDPDLAQQIAMFS